MIIWVLTYQLTVGTVCYSSVTEIFSRRLPIKTAVLGRNLCIFAAVICSTITPYMINPTAWDWGSFAGFFWAGMAFLCCIYTYFWVPEPKGRTFAEMDLLLERRVSARKFASTEVDVFGETSIGSVVSRHKDGLAAEHCEVTKLA